MLLTKRYLVLTIVSLVAVVALLPLQHLHRSLSLAPPPPASAATVSAFPPQPAISATTAPEKRIVPITRLSGTSPTGVPPLCLRCQLPVVSNGRPRALHATPNVLHRDEPVIVQWEYSQAEEGDRIAVFTSNDPAKYLHARYLGKEAAAAKRGTLTFELINMRVNYEFRYIPRRPPLSEIELASNPVCTNLCSPMHGHLAYHEGPVAMSVMWISGIDLPPAVEFGTDPSALNARATGSSATYTASEMTAACVVPKHRKSMGLAREYFQPPGMIHRVRLADLEPDTRYYYRFGADLPAGNVSEGEEGSVSSALWSTVQSFVTRPIPGTAPRAQGGEEYAASGAVRLAVVGDLGTRKWPDMNRFSKYWPAEPSWATTMRLANATRTELTAPPLQCVVHLGDISYSIGFAIRWEHFHHQLEPLATRAAYMVVEGNHDTMWDDSFGECGVPILRRFDWPGHPRTYYSFDVAFVHVVCLSTERDTAPQLRWLEEDLRSVNRSRTPWVIVTGHRPMYTSDTHSARVRSAERHREILEPVFRRHGVHASFWGHVHNYERTCLVHAGNCVEANGSVSAIVGTGGKETTPQYFTPEQPKWSRRRHSSYGYGEILATRDVFEFRFVSTRDGSFLDEWAIHANGSFEDRWKPPPPEAEARRAR